MEKSDCILFGLEYVAAAQTIHCQPCKETLARRLRLGRIGWAIAGDVRKLEAALTAVLVSAC